MNRRLFLGTLLLPGMIRGQTACRPGFVFREATANLGRMAGPLGAGRITVELAGAALTTRGGPCVVHNVDFVSLRANGVPAFASSRRGRWELPPKPEVQFEPETKTETETQLDLEIKAEPETEAETKTETGTETNTETNAILIQNRGLPLEIYGHEFHDSATIRRFAGTPPGTLSLQGVLRLEVASSGGSPEEIFVEFDSAGDVQVSEAGGMTTALATAALEQLESGVEEARRWRDRLWDRIAPRIALIGEVSGKLTGLAAAMGDGILWGAGRGPAERAWLRGDRPRDSVWLPGEAVAIRRRSENVLEFDRVAADVEPLERAEVAAQGFTEAAVFRAFRSASGQAWLEARFLRARRRDNQLELFPEVDEHSFGSPLVLQDGIAGVVTGYSEARPVAQALSLQRRASARRKLRPY